MTLYDVTVIGAGPAGLACAIEAQKRRLSCLTVDKGSIADAIRRFPTSMTFFSTPELLEVGGVPFLSSGFRPTRVECVRYYQKVASHFNLQLTLQTEVKGIRNENGHFEVLTAQGVHRAKNVVVATGYFDSPNVFSVPGSDLPKVHRYYTEPFEFWGRDVAVVGGRNSAVEVVLDLFRAGARVTLIHRGPKLSDGVKYWILPDIENRIKAGEVRALFETTVKSITRESIVVQGHHNEEFRNDALFVMIGYRPEESLLKSVGVSMDDTTLAPVHNRATMETNVKGLYVAGSIAAGKHNNRIFIENGRLHGALIIDSILQSR